MVKYICSVDRGTIISYDKEAEKKAAENSCDLCCDCEAVKCAC